ncbi:MAG: aminotransferase class I/II-fold pyridoxal phosphate-dependent enzyme [Fibrobacterota bacterium]
MKGLTTRAVQGVVDPADGHHALRPPLHDSVAFEFESSQAIANSFAGRHPAHSYSRITNPTVANFEKRIKNLCGAQSVLALSSGMAAVAALVTALAETGAKIVAARSLFGNTRSLFSTTFAQWGLEVVYVDAADPDAVAGHLDSRTRFVFLESLSNPGLQVPPVDEICRAAAHKSIPVILDGTLTFPAIFNARRAGVALEVVSSTKYISGGATSTGGLIVDYGTFNWKNNPNTASLARAFGPYALSVRLRREVYRNTGACLAPHNAWLQTLGLETVGLRSLRSCETAKKIAAWLAGDSRTVDVDYPGLKSCSSYEQATRQFEGLFGSLITFDLASKKDCFAVMDTLKIIRRATNLNDNKSLIIHPASTIFCEFSPREREDMGVRDTMLRLSVGIEDFDDLVDDIQKGLDRI